MSDLQVKISMGTCLIVILGVSVLSGCTRTSRLQNTVPPKVAFEASLRPLADEWLGKTRDARIKAKGFPDRCAKVEGNEEVCEWLTPGQHHLIYTYDGRGLARAWSYRGPYGSFGSQQENPDRSRVEQGSSKRSSMEQLSRSM
jgi:hypothetical protein